MTLETCDILENKNSVIEFLKEKRFEEETDYEDREFPNGTYFKIGPHKLLVLYESTEQDLKRIKDHFLIDRGLSYCIILLKDKLLFLRNFGEQKYFIYSQRTKNVVSKIDRLNQVDKQGFDFIFQAGKDISALFYETFKLKRDILVQHIKNEAEPIQKYLISQKIFDRVFFIYFLCHKGIIKVNGAQVSGKALFEVLLSEGDFFQALKNLFHKFNVPGTERTVKVGNFVLEVPYLNGGLFRPDIFEQKLDVSLKNTKWQEIFDFLNSFHWIIEDVKANEENEDKILTPEILGHVYERSVIEWEMGIDKQAEESVSNTTERNRKGVYYTPEQITEYISNNTIKPFLMGKLDQKYGSFEELIDSGNKLDEKAALSILNDIKVLDPACGSGAFLIKAAEVIFNLKRRLNYELTSAINPYDLKLDIITNNIYGVDILAGATEISKLRLWLWLISDYEETKNEIRALPNIEYNIRVGNSLVGWQDEKLVQMPINTPLTEKVDGILTGLIAFSEDGDIDNLKKARNLLESYSLNNYIEAYYVLYSIYRKTHGLRAENLRSIIETIRQSIYKTVTPAFLDYVNSKILGIEYGKPQKGQSAKHAILRKNPPVKREDLERHQIFHWRIDFGHIMLHGGFDLIIGNPPYVRSILLRENPETWEYLRLNYSQVISKEFDIYLCFLAKAYSLLAPKGRLGYIMPNKWLHAAMGQAARAFFKENRAIETIVNFGSYQIFRDVTTYTMLIFLLNAKNAKVQFFNYAGQLENENMDLNFSDKINWQNGFLDYGSLSDNPWNLITGKAQSILQKLAPLPKLGEYFTLASGTGTRADSVFFVQKISESKHFYKIFSRQTEKEYQLEKVFIKPSAKGKDLNSYEIRNTDNLLIFPYRDTTLVDKKEIREKSPNLWSYLEDCKNALEGREKGRWKGGGFYCYGRPQNHTLLSTKKILVPVITDRAKAVWDPIGLYVIDSIYFVKKKKPNTISEDYILALLNSNLLTYFLKKTSTNLRGGFFSMKPGYLDKFPLKIASSQNEDRIYLGILEKVKRINSIYVDKSPIAKREIAILKEGIDDLIYKMYGLTDEEIHVINTTVA